MDIFALTETEFFRQLTAGVEGVKNLNSTYKEFIVKVVELCSGCKQKIFAINALVIVEIEISHIQTQADRDSVNEELAVFISKALSFVRSTIATLKDMDIEPVSDDEILSGISLHWVDKKVALVELGYAFKVAKVFGDKLSVKEIVKNLAKAFKVDITDNYIYKKYNEIRVRGGKSGQDEDRKTNRKWREDDDSRTYFLDWLVENLNRHMKNRDQED